MLLNAEPSFHPLGSLRCLATNNGNKKTICCKLAQGLEPDSQFHWNGNRDSGEGRKTMVYIVYSAERTKIHDNNSTKFQRQQIELMCLGVSTVV